MRGKKHINVPAANKSGMVSSNKQPNRRRLAPNGEEPCAQICQDFHWTDLIAPASLSPLSFNVAVLWRSAQHVRRTGHVLRDCFAQCRQNKARLGHLCHLWLVWTESACISILPGRFGEEEFSFIPMAVSGEHGDRGGSHSKSLLRSQTFSPHSLRTFQRHDLRQGSNYVQRILAMLQGVAGFKSHHNIGFFASVRICLYT